MKRIKLIAVILIAFTTIAYGATYTLVPANYLVNVNGQKMNVTPLNYNGTTYLPLRSVSEAVGVPIEWNNAKKSVEINTLDLDRLKEACVMIYADDGKYQTQGSAVYIDYNEALTAFHITDQRPNVKSPDGLAFAVDDGNKDLDVSVLYAMEEIKPVKIGDSDEVKKGDKVLLISSPQGKEDVVMFGTVKEIGKEIVISGTSDKGSSGGALFNINGELIGILVAGDTGIKECYITPINAIRKAL